MKKVKSSPIGKRKSSTNKQCTHFWFYLHSIWSTSNKNSVAVGRYCGDCGEMQTATAKDWRALPKSYVDMRASLEDAIDNRR